MRRDHGEIYPRFDEVYVSQFLKTMCIWQPLLSLRVSRTEQADQFRGATVPFGLHYTRCNLYS